MATDSRPYEIVLLGATGYTGRLTADYIQEHVATDLRWAIAGRNGKKLAAIAEELKTLNPDRVQPVVEVAELNSEDLNALARKTKAIITTVGPYASFGEPVVKACVENGTHVLDVTGETPYTFDMMQKYHEAAKAKGVCIVPHCGIDSVPSDLSAYLCAKAAREKLNVGLTDCVCTLQKISGAVSGGTAHTAITLVEAYPLTFLGKSMRPHALCPVPPPKKKPSTSTFLSSLLGWRSVPDLGVLTDSPQSASDVGIVYRSWGLFDGGTYYGPNFTFSEFLRVRNGLIGSFVHYMFATTMIALYLRPFRWLLKRYAYAPGTGPTKEESAKNFLSYKAIAHTDDPKKRRAYSTFDYQGAGYYMTGITLTEAALVLTRGGDVLGKRLGGMVTSATLEMEYVERLQKAGIKLDWGILDT